MVTFTVEAAELFCVCWYSTPVRKTLQSGWLASSLTRAEESSAAVGTPLKGVARLQTSLEQTDAGLVQYAIGDDLPLVSFGPVWVQASKAVAAGALAYAIISGGDKGKFTDTSAATTTTAPVGWFEPTTTGAANAVLFVQR